MENILKETGSYRLTKKDVHAFVWDSLIQTNLYLRIISIAIGAGIGVGIPYGFISHSWANFMALFIWVFLAVLIFNIIKISRISSLPQNKEIIEHDIIIQLSESHIIGRKNSNISGYSWKNVHLISQSKNNIFIYFKENSAYIIPKSAFDNEQELLEFLETAYQLMAKANIAP